MPGWIRDADRGADEEQTKAYYLYVEDSDDEDNKGMRAKPARHQSKLAYISPKGIPPMTVSRYSSLSFVFVVSKEGAFMPLATAR